MEEESSAPSNKTEAFYQSPLPPSCVRLSIPFNNRFNFEAGKRSASAAIRAGINNRPGRLATIIMGLPKLQPRMEDDEVGNGDNSLFIERVVSLACQSL